MKRGNRRGERALHDAELLDALRGDGRANAELDRLWRVLLLNQFHDILPGSSITEVNVRARADLDERGRAAPRRRRRACSGRPARCP